MQLRSGRFSPISLLPLVAALGATVPAASAAAQDLPDRPRGMFLEPRITLLRSGDRLVQLKPNAILAWELAAVPPALVTAPVPVPLPRGFDRLDLPAGALFLEELWPDGRAACLYLKIPRGTPGPTPLCLFDSDGDGRSDRAVTGDRSGPIAPIRLVPAEIPAAHPGAATIERRLYVGGIDGSYATIVDGWAIRPSEGLPNYDISIVGSQLPNPWPARLRIPLRAGARASAWGLRFQVRQGGDGAWWVAVSGAMTKWVQLREPGTVVDHYAGTLERPR